MALYVTLSVTSFLDVAYVFFNLVKIPGWIDGHLLLSFGGREVIAIVNLGSWWRPAMGLRPHGIVAPKQILRYWRHRPITAGFPLRIVGRPPESRQTQTAPTASTKLFLLSPDEAKSLTLGSLAFAFVMMFPIFFYGENPGAPLHTCVNDSASPQIQRWSCQAISIQMCSWSCDGSLLTR